MPSRAIKPATVSPRITRSWLVNRCTAGVGAGASAGSGTSTVTLAAFHGVDHRSRRQAEGGHHAQRGKAEQGRPEGQLPDGQERGEALR